LRLAFDSNPHASLLARALRTDRTFLDDLWFESGVWRDALALVEELRSRQGCRLPAYFGALRGAQRTRKIAGGAGNAGGARLSRAGNCCGGRSIHGRDLTNPG